SSDDAHGCVRVTAIERQPDVDRCGEVRSAKRAGGDAGDRLALAFDLERASEGVAAEHTLLEIAADHDAGSPAREVPADRAEEIVGDEFDAESSARSAECGDRWICIAHGDEVAVRNSVTRFAARRDGGDAAG